MGADYLEDDAISRGTGMTPEESKAALVRALDRAIEPHTPTDPGADECAADSAGEFERDLSEYGVEL